MDSHSIDRLRYRRSQQVTPMILTLLRCILSRYYKLHRESVNSAQRIPQCTKVRCQAGFTVIGHPLVRWPGRRVGRRKYTCIWATLIGVHQNTRVFGAGRAARNILSGGPRVSLLYGLHAGLHPTSIVSNMFYLSDNNVICPSNY